MSSAKEEKSKKLYEESNIYLFIEIEKATKNINDEMTEYAEKFYNGKKDKEKDDGFEL